MEVVLHEGRKHIVRRLLDAVGYPVLSLVRTAGRSGAARPTPSRASWRALSKDEVAALYKAAGL